MREALEVVLEDFKLRRLVLIGETLQYPKPTEAMICSRQVIDYAIRKIEEVLAQRETDNSNRANGNGTDDRGDGQANQVETIWPG